MILTYFIGLAITSFLWLFIAPESKDSPVIFPVLMFYPITIPIVIFGELGIWARKIIDL